MSPRILVAAVLGVMTLAACDTVTGVGGVGSPTSTSSDTAAQSSTSSVSPSTASQPTTTSPPRPTAPTPTTAVPGVAGPDPRLTPGEVFPNATVGQICMPGYAASVRHVTLEQYHEVYAEYGIAYPEPSGTYELDHLIPLELGGDNANANLWPEPARPTPGFHQKDDLENAMHHLVCSGRLDLREAQHEIATDWYAAYVRYVGG